jgi:hypothetical protein
VRRHREDARLLGQPGLTSGLGHTRYPSRCHPQRPERHTSSGKKACPENDRHAQATCAALFHGKFAVGWGRQRTTPLLAMVEELSGQTSTIYGGGGAPGLLRRGVGETGSGRLQADGYGQTWEEAQRAYPQRWEAGEKGRATGEAGLRHEGPM